MAKKKTKKPASKSKPPAKKAAKPARKKPTKAPAKTAPKTKRKPAAKPVKRAPARVAKPVKGAPAHVTKPTAPLAKPIPLAPAITVWMEEAWPDRVIDFARLQFDSSYLVGVVDRLRADLITVEPDCAFHERAPIVGDAWISADMDDLPSEGDFPRSYYLFFVGPQGSSFEGPCETLVENKAGETVTVRGQFRWGWTVAISFVSPVAALVPDTIAVYPNGTIDHLELNLHFQDDEAPAEVEDGAAKARMSPAAWEKLATIRNRIVAVLGKHGIKVLRRETLGVPVLGYRAGERILIESEYLRVKDAFFFRAN